MVNEDLGQATLVYEGPDGEPIERTVDNEHVAYFQDHWVVKTDEHEAEHDTIRRIPADRVYYVERDVEEFEEEVATALDEVQSVADGVGEEFQTIRDRIESVADEVQTGLLGGRRRGERTGESETDVVRIDVESGASTTGQDDATEDDGEQGAEEDDSSDGEENPTP